MRFKASVATTSVSNEPIGSVDFSDEQVWNELKLYGGATIDPDHRLDPQQPTYIPDGSEASKVCGHKSNTAL